MREMDKVAKDRKRSVTLSPLKFCKCYRQYTSKHFAKFSFILLLVTDTQYSLSLDTVEIPHHHHHHFNLLKIHVICNFQVLNGVKCPTLALLTTFATDAASLPTAVATYMGLMTKERELYVNKQNFQHINLKGNHDVHINNPEIVAPHIVRFLTKHRCAL
jgi:hypothetical protein